MIQARSRQVASPISPQEPDHTRADAVRQVDEQEIEGKAEDVDGISDDEEEDGLRLRRRVGPRVEAPAAAGGDQKPAASEEEPAAAGATMRLLYRRRIRPLDLPESDHCPSLSSPRQLSGSVV